MAKQSGIGASLFVAQYDISGDVGAIDSAETSRGQIDVTAINASAMERLNALRDGSLSFASFWNTAAGQAVPVLNALPRTDRICSAFFGSALGGPACSISGKQLNYAVARGQDGSLGAKTDVKANGAGMGLEWGEMLTTGKQSFGTGTVDGSSIDLGAVSTLFGAAGYLHVFSVASGTATFAIQDSADNVTFADISGLVFTGAAGATSERLQTSATATVRRYIRLEGRGVHGAAVVAVNFVRYTESVTA